MILTALRRPLFRRGAAKAARGMTLLEIMVVITIIGVVMAIVGVAVLPQLDAAKADTTKQSMSNVLTAMKLYYVRHGKYPDTGSGFNALVTEGMLEKEPLDGFGNKMIYMNEGGKPVIISYGKDGAPGGDGVDADISSNSLDAPAK